MKNIEIIEAIEVKEVYCKVKIDKEGEITGMRIDQDYRYDTATNTGGRRYIGNVNDIDLMHIID